jgi:hypothetical protein
MSFREIIATYSENHMKLTYSPLLLMQAAHVVLTALKCLNAICVAVFKTINFHACLPIEDYCLHTTYYQHHWRKHHIMPTGNIWRAQNIILTVVSLCFS